VYHIAVSADQAVARSFRRGTVVDHLRSLSMRAFALFATLLFRFGSPPFAADDVATAQSIIRSQVEAFGRDDAAAAYSYAAPGIHEIFPQADIFLGMVQNNYAPVYRHKSFEFGEARTADGKIAQQVHIVDSNGVPW